MGCESFSSIATRIWDEWDEVLKTVGAGIGTSATGVPPEVIYTMATEYEDAIRKAVSRWNQLVGDSWAKLGPRRITLGDADEGTVVNPGERTFLTPGPMAADELEVAIRSRDGNAECEVTVCAHPKSGRPRKLWTATFAKGNDNDGTSKTHTLKGVRGCVLSINLKPRGALKSFSYRVKLSKAASRAPVGSKGGE